MPSSWERIASATLTGTNAELNSGTFTPKDHLRVVFNGFNQSADSDVMMRVGTGGTIDTGANYTWRNCRNGGSDSEQHTQNELQIVGGSFNTSNATSQGVIQIVNKSDEEKLFSSHTGTAIAGSGSTAGQVPDRIELAGKWGNTAGQINTIRIFVPSNSAVFAIGASITVFGADDQTFSYTYPLVPAGSIFEESDTGKHYMWDGTNTWNEVG